MNIVKDYDPHEREDSGVIKVFFRNGDTQEYKRANHVFKEDHGVTLQELKKETVQEKYINWRGKEILGRTEVIEKVYFVAYFPNEVILKIESGTQ